MKRLKQINLTGVLIIILFSFSSCGALIQNIILKSRIGIEERKAKPKYITNNGKEIIFIPMHHVGRPEFYNSVKEIVDTLQKSDYVVFYEGVAIRNMDANDTLSVLKIRKLGTQLGEYYDSSTNLISNSVEYKGKYKITNQPKYSKLGVDSITAINADMGINELISNFEKKCGEIFLDECDYETPLLATYTCEKTDFLSCKIFRKEYIVDLRNLNLASEVLKSENKKIIII